MSAPAPGRLQRGRQAVAKSLSTLGMIEGFRLCRGQAMNILRHPEKRLVSFVVIAVAALFIALSAGILMTVLIFS